MLYNATATLFARLTCAMLLLAALALPAAAQPPALLHYQGRLTNASGAPLTTAQTLWFSLWSGGTDAAANSGTQLYRERATLTPDANGIFEHQIGAGTVELGTLTPALFNTSAAIHLQVAQGAVGTVLLPRTRVSSVGYAMVAGQAATALSAGTPLVSAITDVTGGLTVPGDLIQIDGSGLAAAEVAIGGKLAPLKTRTAGQIVAQVPGGLAMGLQPVVVSPAGVTGGSNTVGHIRLTRLAIVVQATGSGTDLVVVINAATRAVLNSFDPTTDIGNVAGGQVTFAQNGALALVPAMGSGAVLAINMTANPPALVQTLSDGNINPALACAASPDGRVLAVSSAGANRVRVYTIAESFPPYTAPLTATGATSLAGIPAGNGPRGLAFVGDGLLLVAGSLQSPAVSLGYRRTPSAGTLAGQFATSAQQVQVGATPQALDLTPDRTRAIFTTRAANNIEAYYIEPDGLSLNLSGTGPYASGGAGALRSAVAPDGVTILTANPIDDVINIAALNGGTTRFVGEHLGAVDSAEYQVVDIEPVEGKLVVASTDFGLIELFERAGGALMPLVTLNGSGAARSTVDVRFQP